MVFFDFRYKELKCDSDDDIGFYDRNKTGNTSNQKSRKCSNENLSEDSGFCSDHAISKKLSCQFQPYDKEEFFIYNKNFASTNFGTSCQNLTMLSDREPSAKFFHSKNSNTKTSNGCQSREFPFGFSVSQFDTISGYFFLFLIPFTHRTFKVFEKCKLHSKNIFCKINKYFWLMLQHQFGSVYKEFFKIFATL